MARGQSLYEWCIENGEYGQQLLFEFGDGNNSQQFFDEETGMFKCPLDYTKGSTKKVKWTCNKGHTWHATVHNRTLRKSGCPQCNKELQSIKQSTPKQGINDLYTWCLNNGEYGKQLLQEFQGIDEHGNRIKPTEITSGSHKKVKWICNKGHTWNATVKHRTLCKSGCPRCSYKLQAIKQSIPTQGTNDLHTWCLNNGEWGQQLLQEFQGLDEYGNKIAPTEITRGSGKNVLWKCNKGHTWYATVLNRAFNRNGCPYCSVSGTSYPEQFLYKALLQIYPKTISRGRYQGIEYDIAIPEEKICIEYSGITWHADKLDRDEMKANICREHNVRFIQIYAHNGEIDTEDIFDKNQIIYRASSGIDKHNQQLVYILDHILKSLGHSISEINIKKAQTDAYNVIKSFKGKRL